MQRSSRMFHQFLFHRCFRYQFPKSLSTVSATATKPILLENTSKIDPTPPLLVRSALVGVTVALATPTFPVIGYVQLLHKYTSHETRKLVLAGSSVGFIVFDGIPFAYEYAPVILPFAIANGLTAGCVYTCLDVLFGGPSKMDGISGWLKVGSVTGVTTAIVAPYLYGPFVDVFYKVETGDFFLNFFHNEIILPISMLTGLGAGFILHSILRPVLLGFPGLEHHHWTSRAGAVLAAALLLFGYVFSAARFKVTKQKYSSMHDLSYIMRIDPTTAEPKIFNLLSKKYEGDIDVLQRSVSCRRLIEQGEAVFPSKVSAWYAEKTFNILQVEPQISGSTSVALTKAQRNHLLIDGLVACAVISERFLACDEFDQRLFTSLWHFADSGELHAINKAESIIKEKFSKTEKSRQGSEDAVFDLEFFDRLGRNTQSALALWSLRKLPHLYETATDIKGERLMLELQDYLYTEGYSDLELLFKELENQGLEPSPRYISSFLLMKEDDWWAWSKKVAQAAASICLLILVGSQIHKTKRE